MYYLLNLLFTLSISIVIGLVCRDSAPSGFISVALIIGIWCNLIASAYAESKYRDLKDRIKKLEDMKLESRKESEK